MFWPPGPRYFYNNNILLYVISYIGRYFYNNNDIQALRVLKVKKITPSGVTPSSEQNLAPLGSLGALQPLPKGNQKQQQQKKKRRLRVFFPTSRRQPRQRLPPAKRTQETRSEQDGGFGILSPCPVPALQGMRRDLRREPEPAVRSLGRRGLSPGARAAPKHR